MKTVHGAGEAADGVVRGRPDEEPSFADDVVSPDGIAITPVETAAVSTLAPDERRSGMTFVLVSVFLDMLGMGIVFPVLPILVGELVPGRSEQSYWFGALASAYGLGQFAFAPFLGGLSDRFGRRPVLVAAIAGLGLYYAIVAVAPSLWLMLAARLLGGMTAASFSVASAYASDISTPETRAKTFGRVGAALGVGFVAGPLLGGLLGDVDLRLPFWVAAAISLVNAIYGFFFVPESLPDDRRTAFSLRRANPLSALARLARRSDVAGTVVAFALHQLAHMILVHTLVLYTHFRFDWGTRTNGLYLFGVGFLAATVQGFLLGRLVARLGEQRVALLGLTTGFFAYLGYGLSTAGWMMFAILAANFLTFAISPAIQGIVSKTTDPREQGVTIGSLQSITSLAGVLAPVLGMPILAMVSHLAPSDPRVGGTFFLCAALQLVAWGIARRSWSGG